MIKLARALTLATLLGCSGGTEPTRPSTSPPALPPTPPPTQDLPPVFSSTCQATANENDLYSCQASATDPEGKQITYSVSGPSWLSINQTNGLISGTVPEIPSDTLYNIVITASDGTNQTTQPLSLAAKNIFNRYVLTENQLTDTEVSDSNLVFPAAQTFIPNDMLVAGITSKTPEGTLRKVVSVSSDKKTIGTEQASLEEIIKKTTIALQKPLTLSDVQDSLIIQGAALATTANAEGFNFGVGLKNVVLYDRDGNPGTIEDRLIANGNINFNLDLLLDMSVENHTINSLKFQQKIEQSSDITIGSSISGLAAIIDVKIAEYSFNPLVLGFIPAPIPVPIIVKPKIGIYASINPTKVNPLSVNVKQSTDVTAGVEFSNGSWKNLGSHETALDFSFLAPVQGDWDLNFSAGPRLEAKLYGVAGPSASLNGRLRLTSQNNNWKLYGGLISVLGVDAKIFGKNFTAYAGKVLDYEKLLAEKDTMQQQTVTDTIRIGPPGKDAFVRHTAFPNGTHSYAGFADSSFLHFDRSFVSGSGTEHEGLLYFPLTNIPANSKINSAKLRVYGLATSNSPTDKPTITLAKLLGSWDENVKWDAKPSKTDITSIDFVNEGTASWYEFNVASLVQAWVNGEANHGLGLLTKENDVFGRIYSGDYVAFDQRPTLIITYVKP